MTIRSRRDPGGGAPAPDDIRRARETIARVVEPTPMLRCRGISVLAGREVTLKAENLQLTGSFKIRGACNRIFRLERASGVIAASAGNHAQGVALAAKLAGLPAAIVMPEETPLIKVERTRALGAEVILHGGSFEEAFEEACRLAVNRKRTLVHAYEDFEVIAGQGTIGLEILEAAPDLDALIVPVGGGGLIAGIAIAARSLSPGLRIIGVQARGAAPAVRAFSGDRPTAALRQADTIADAIRFKTASRVTMPILRKYVDEMVTVSEEEIAEAIVRLMEEAKLVAEGAGAAPVAALLAGRIPSRCRRVCAVVSGGNIDLNMAARVLEQGLSRSNRYLVLRCLIPDKPGRLFGILTHCAAHKVNVLDVRHNRAGWKIPLGWVEVELLVETRNAGHAASIVSGLREAGYGVRRAERPEPPTTPAGRRGSGKRASAGRGTAGRARRRG